MSDIKGNLLIFLFRFLAGVYCLVSSFGSAVQPRDFCFDDERHGQTPAALQSDDGVSEAAGRHSGSAL